MAWRLWYQPQVGHTTWGSLAAEQRGQMLREGAASFQFAAWRLRLFILLVFFFGTAIAGLLFSGPSEVSGSVLQPQIVEGCPPGVAHLGRAPAVGLVAVGTAGGAQAGAVVGAQRREGQLEQHDVAHHLGELDG